MKNPFILYSERQQTNYVPALCSLNKLKINKLPVCGVDDGIEGKSASQLISAKIIADDVAFECNKAGIDISDYEHSRLPVFISQGCQSQDPIIRAVSRSLGVKYGNRLGLILLTLRLGQKENRLARPEWTDEHWDYFKNIKTIIFAGGLTSSMLGKIFKAQIQYVFDLAGAKPYNILMFENCSHIGIMGGASLIKDRECCAALLDCGQTSIKRSTACIRNGELNRLTALSDIPSRFMQEEDDPEQKRRLALSLHSHIINAACDAFLQAKNIGAPSGDIIISIANYTEGGILNPERGGYAKLSVLAQNYAELLSEDVSSALHRRINVRLVHDATAAALYFSGYPDSVCITLGTGFGVGFPDFSF